MPIATQNPARKDNNPLAFARYLATRFRRMGRKIRGLAGFPDLDGARTPLCRKCAGTALSQRFGPRPCAPSPGGDSSAKEASRTHAPSPRPPPPEGRGSFVPETPRQSRKTAAIPTPCPPPLGGGAGGRGIAGKDPPLPNFALPDFRRGSHPTAAPLVCQGRKKTSVSAGFQRSPPPHRSADRRPDIPNGKRLPGCETRPAGQGSRRLVPPDRGGKGIDIREVWGRPGTAARAVRALMETDIGDKNLYVKEKSEIIGIMFGICPNAPFDFAQGRLLRLRSGQAPSIRPALRYAACGGYSG